MLRANSPENFRRLLDLADLTDVGVTPMPSGDVASVVRGLLAHSTIEPSVSHDQAPLTDCRECYSQDHAQGEGAFASDALTDQRP